MANHPQRLKPLCYGLVAALGVVAIDATAHVLDQRWIIALIGSPAIPIFVATGLDTLGYSWLWIAVPALTWGLIVAAVAWFAGLRRTSQIGRAGTTRRGGG